MKENIVKLDELKCVVCVGQLGFCKSLESGVPATNISMKPKKSKPLATLCAYPLL